MPQRMSTSASHGVVPEKPTKQVLQSYLGIIPSSLLTNMNIGEVCSMKFVYLNNSHVLKYNKML